MPRGRTTTAPKKTTTALSQKEDKAKKIEPQEFASCASTSNKSPNLYSGKFEKKKRPRIKIQYEEDSPVNQEQESESAWEPPHWQDFLRNLRTMTANGDAPVDTKGCHMSSDPDAPPEVIRYQHLIYLMLSTHTKDPVTYAAMDHLRERGLTIDNVLSMSDFDLGNLICPVQFWKLKVRYIKKTSKILKEQYNGDIPDSVEELCKLPGVGPKTAHMCMKVAWNKVTGIGVDSHVHRISNRIGWVKQPTATKEDTRKALEDWLPLELWGEVNHSLIGFGQKICLPFVPNCEECLNKDICPSRVIKSPKKKIPTKGKVTIHQLNVPNTSQDNLKLPFDSTSNSDIKVQRKRKVTSKKAAVEQEVTDDGDENLVAVSNFETLQQRKMRVTPKRTVLKQAVTNVSEENLFVSDYNYLQQRKRKVSPKKPIEQEPTDVNASEECLIVLDTSDEEEPRRRRVTPAKESKHNDKVTNKLATKALPKRKITAKKAQLQQNDEEFVQPVLLEVNSNVKIVKHEESNSHDVNLKVPVDSTSNSDTKVQRKRKVTPKKAVVDQEVTEHGEENLVAVSNSETSQQRKRRVTPKRTALKQAVTNASKENLFVSDSNCVQQRKRKVSPKKPTEQEPTDVNTIEERLEVLHISDQKEPRRRRVTPVKESKQGDKGTNKLASKALPKRKITPKKTQSQQNDEDFVQPVLLEVNSNVQIVVNSPVKRRSPRVPRNTDDVKPASNRRGRNNTKTS